MNEERPRKSLARMAIEANTGEDGKLAIVCPQCGCRDSRVTNTWTSGGSVRGFVGVETAETQ